MKIEFDPTNEEEARSAWAAIRAQGYEWAFPEDEPEPEPEGSND